MYYDINKYLNSEYINNNDLINANMSSKFRKLLMNFHSDKITTSDDVLKTKLYGIITTLFTNCIQINKYINS